jgi:hypothetical protein
MFDPILLAALLTTVLLGGALFRVLRAERRRANLEPLLSTIAMTVRSADAQVFSLRRSGLQRNALPTLLSSRLDLVFASTGNRIGPAHLVAVGIAALLLSVWSRSLRRFIPYSPSFSAVRRRQVLRRCSSGLHRGDTSENSWRYFRTRLI